MLTRERITSLVTPELTERGLELVGLQLVPGRRRIVRVFIDRAGGVNVGDCAEVSRALARRLDAELPGAGNYVLEVSSPGMNRPVETVDQYRRFMGERVKLELKDPREGQMHFEGTIESVEGERIRFRVKDDQILELTVDAIASAHLEIDPWKGRRKASGRG